jgi:3-phenylpropionate/trans-cinnamate dioxygenase ferredoxin component
MTRQVEVGIAGEIAGGQRKLVFVEGRGVVLFNIEGTFHAIDAACPHNGASLASGRLDGCVLSCPAHGLRFDVRTGCMAGAAGLNLVRYAVATVDSKLVVTLDEQGAMRPEATEDSAVQHCASNQEKQKCKV